jgi:hypothetical protein
MNEHQNQPDDCVNITQGHPRFWLGWRTNEASAKRTSGQPPTSRLDKWGGTKTFHFLQLLQNRGGNFCQNQNPCEFYR